MKFSKEILFGLTFLFFASCATTYQVTSDYERAVNFSAFKTFQILKQKNSFPAGANPINKQRIDRAILKEMNTLNFDTSTNPDLLVAWFVKVKNVKDVNVYHDYYGRWNRRDYVEVNNYQEGTLIIDIIDRAKKQVVWHGTASDRVYDHMPNVEEKINEVVYAMFRKFAKDAKIPRTYAAN